MSKMERLIELARAIWREAAVYVVTGAAGFIGSNVVRALNARGDEDILVVDDGEALKTSTNLSDCTFADAMDKGVFRERVTSGTFDAEVAAILHQGACADTMESDEAYMMDNNLAYSKDLLTFALGRKTPFVYASSASVYGVNRDSAEMPANEAPLNLYARSKLAFDEHVRSILEGVGSTVVGLRYFNVYGPGEARKGRMASMVYRLCRQLMETGVARLFEGTDGYGDGEQRRDFVYVGDVAGVNLFFAGGPATRGIFNVGTGNSRSFNDAVNAATALLGGGRVEYIPFPAELQGKYQSFTEADLSQLRAAGCAEPFTSLEDGIERSLPCWKE